jgi:Flp pilus assembly protein TadG
MSCGGESGAVTVLFALGISALLLCAAFAVDTASWFHHRSHLQLQADAAAFAAASQFNYPCTKTVEQAIYGTAGQYGGVGSVIAPGGKTESSTTPLYNAQVGQAPKSQGAVYEKINSKSYYGQPATDNTVEKPPCDPESTVIDVKMTETKLPGLFSVVGKIFNVPYVNAHARVSIVQQKYASAVEPLIESEPVEARVFYVNDERCENSKKEFVTCADGTTTNYEQQQLATGLLTNVGSNEEKGTIKWTNASAPVPLNITAPHIGVRVALAGKIGALKGAGNETVAVCHHEYVECFDEDSGIVPPLMQIAGYSNEGTGKGSPFEPVAHKVSLSTPSPNTCSDGYFALRVGPEQEQTCTMTVTAALEYASTSTKGVTVTPELVYTPGFSGGQKKVLQAAMTAPTLQPAEPW